VLDEAQMAELGMGALLGVGQGSVRPPRLLAMRWNGAGDPGRKPVVLIGKGITFDTGGISIKPAQGMESMKWDMGGAGAVAGAMKAIAGARPSERDRHLRPRREHAGRQRPAPGRHRHFHVRPDHRDHQHGRRGRLVLADAMTWAQRQYQPAAMVDLATLTGAMIIALGHEYAGLFSNDDQLAERLTQAGQASGDRLWRFPLGEAYDKQMDSPVADMKNAGPREGGSIMAATFLQRFVDEGTKWAHLDVAGNRLGEQARHPLRQRRDRLWRGAARPLRGRQLRELTAASAGRLLPP
jgi:leucyl aminopeptidase